MKIYIRFTDKWIENNKEKKAAKELDKLIELLSVVLPGVNCKTVKDNFCEIEGETFLSYEQVCELVNRAAEACDLSFDDIELQYIDNAGNSYGIRFGSLTNEDCGEKSFGEQSGQNNPDGEKAVSVGATGKEKKQAQFAAIAMKAFSDSDNDKKAVAAACEDAYEDKTDYEGFAGFAKQAGVKDEDLKREQFVKDYEAEKGKETLGEIQKRISDMKAELSRKVKGQPHAIAAFVRAYFGAEVLADKGRKGPLATFFFAGPPGCGKTYLAECAAPFCKGRPYLRVNMSEYGETGAPLNGSDMIYKTPGVVTSFVAKNPKCIILFDEIEKASQSNLKLFLQILDAGTIRDAATKKDVSFRDTILIFTTNVAKNLYEDSENANLASIPKNAVIAALESDKNPLTGRPYFPKELVSRWAKGTVVLFNRLEPYAVKEIVLGQLKREINSAAENMGVKIECNYDRIASLIMYSVGGSGDARSMTGAVSRFVDSELFDAVSQYSRKKMDISSLRKIYIDVDYKKSAVAELFEEKGKLSLLVAADKKYKKEMKEICDAACVKQIFRTDIKSVKEAFRNDVSAFVLDIFAGEKNMQFRPSDLEDIDSDGVELFGYVRTNYPEIPVYVLNDADAEYDDAAFDTFLAKGAKGVLRFDKDDKEDSIEEIEYIRNATVTGNNFYKLSRSLKVVSYNGAQIINDDGSEMKILARRLTVKRAVRAEDAADVLADVSKPKERFADVVGASEAKKSMKEFISYLSNPKKYTASGLKAPKGILMYGPPGTGKTLLAKALAGETDVTFIEKNGTSFFNKYVGEGPESIRRLFRTARRYAPSIIFIDEVDAFAKKRTGSEYTQAAEQLLNTFLSEMEGFRVDENRPVIVLAATNFSIKDNGKDSRVLDAAFVRRFDRKILIGLPDKKDREELIKFFLSRHGIDTSDLENGIELMAKKCVGYSPCDIMNMVNDVVKGLNGEEVTVKMLEEAQDKYEYGDKKEYSGESMLRTARHEAGHAIISWANGKVPAYVTVVARGNYGGYMMHDDESEEKGVMTKPELLDAICCSLGGRAAELVYYGEDEGLTTGPSSDLESATELAYDLVGSWGMTDDGMAVTGYFGDALERQIYERVNAILRTQLERAKKILTANKDAVDKLVSVLAEKNSVNADELKELIGNSPTK